MSEFYTWCSNHRSCCHTVVSLLSSLSSLDVSCNSIVTLTPSLCHMKNLTTLNVYGNKLAMLPDGEFDLSLSLSLALSLSQ